jgi:hypothetical protein
MMPIFQALVTKQQDPDDAHCYNISSFDLLPKYTALFQTSAVMHISFFCQLEAVHAAACAVLGNQPFIGGGKSSLSSERAQMYVKELGAYDVGHRMRIALALCLQVHVVQPLYHGKCFGSCLAQRVSTGSAAALRFGSKGSQEALETYSHPHTPTPFLLQQPHFHL